MVLRDAKSVGPARHELRAEVVVVGAGIAGLILATRLAKLGVQVVVLESGPEISESAQEHPLNAVVQIGQYYRGAEAGRHRGLGGTSLRWGGAMLPFLECDLEAHTAGWPVDWPIRLKDLEEQFFKIEELFRLPHGPFDPTGLQQSNETSSFTLRSAKWPAFRYRNVAQVLREEIRGKGLEIWTDATVTRFHLGDNGRISAIDAIGPSGNPITVHADTVVLAAGAIETTRLMLLMDAHNGNRIFRPRDVLGRYFFDHISATSAIANPVDSRSLNAAFGLRFEGSGMRDLRIEPSALFRRSERLPGAFAHIVMTSSEDGAFAALRAIYRDLQSNSPLRWDKVAAVSRDLAWFSEAAFWRLAKGRLLAPRNATFELVQVMEQFPNYDSTIELADDRSDIHGTPLAKINWQTHPHDVEAFRGLQSALLSWWGQSRYAEIATLRPIAEDEWRRRISKGSDIFHPGGTTRMATTAVDGVVDANLRSFEIDNLYVVSTSTFPSGGSSNPTFMLMALAMRAAEHIATSIRRAALH